jgi:DNA-binding IclR family transcriptional regulator
MSRTYRHRELNRFITNAYITRRYHCLRRPKTKNEITQLQKAVDEITEEGFSVNNRTIARSNPGSSLIVNAWDDIVIAALSKVDFN